MENKKLFLLNSALLYQNLIEQTDNNCIKRFLAFKIIVNTMSFEDIVGNRKFKKLREVRNIFLAHKQTNKFLKAYNSAELINNTSITRLVTYMIGQLKSKNNYIFFNELTDSKLLKRLNTLSNNILSSFKKEFYSGIRISNNFLCTDANQIKEISSNELSGAFYRYNSSKELSILANDFIIRLSRSKAYPNALQNFKIDYILHAVNMTDCIFKDFLNSHSINGLYEVMTEKDIGDCSILRDLRTDSSFMSLYNRMRRFRNKLAGHIDNRESLSNLLKSVNEFDIKSAFAFVDKLDKAVYDTSQKSMATKIHFMSFKMVMDPKSVVRIKGIKNSDYYL